MALRRSQYLPISTPDVGGNTIATMDARTISGIAITAAVGLLLNAVWQDCFFHYQEWSKRRWNSPKTANATAMQVPECVPQSHNSPMADRLRRGARDLVHYFGLMIGVLIIAAFMSESRRILWHIVGWVGLFLFISVYSWAVTAPYDPSRAAADMKTAKSRIGAIAFLILVIGTVAYLVYWMQP